MRKSFQHVFCGLLILAVLAGCIEVPMSSALTVKKYETHYSLVTSVVFIWCNSAGVWQNGLRPGSSVSYDDRISIGLNRENVKVYGYDPDAMPGVQGYFDFDNENQYHWNRNVLTKNGEDYGDHYMFYAAQNINIRGADTYHNASGFVDIEFNAVLNSEKTCDVKKEIMNGKLHALRILLDGTDAQTEKTLNMMTPDHNNFNVNVKGYLYFIPAIIQYDVMTEEVKEPGPGEKEPDSGEAGKPEPGPEEEMLTARLGLPATAKVNETYMVSDQSWISERTMVKSARLERKDGSSWHTVAVWPGNEKGKHSGGMVRQTETSVGTVTWRLSVTTTGGKTDTDTKTVEVIDGRKMDLKAVLTLPQTVYEGHCVRAGDQSMFSVDGERYSPQRAYAEKIARNTFAVSREADAGITMLSQTEREILWPRTGQYEVELKVNSRINSQSDRDTKPIEVLRAPKILDQLGGVQKENRKQVLSAQVALNPQYPLREFSMELRETESGESVRLIPGGGIANAEHIKTRALTQEEENGCFVWFELSFLTKYHDMRTFEYTIFARDARGHTDEVAGSFVVAPDQPPVADPLLAKEFLRQKGTNRAEILMEDQSRTDNDQLQRTWLVSLTGEPAQLVRAEETEGFQDLAFGTGQKVSVSKEGVGKAAVKLQVKDVWTEETLSEYISESDYLTGESEICWTEVVNVAPVVTLERGVIKRADLLLLAASDQEYRQMKPKVNELSRRLIEAGLDPDIRLVQMNPQPRSDRSDRQQAGVALPIGFNAGKILENSWFSVDEDTLYTVHATWTSGDHDSFPKAPYYITATDVRSGAKKWRYAISQQILSENELYSNVGGFRHDAAGRYLFFVCGNRSLIFNRETGAFLTRLNMAPGNGNLSAGNQIYSAKTDGICRIDTASGKEKRIFSGTITGPARLRGGCLEFFVQTGPLKIYRGSFDPQTEKVSLKPLETGDDPPGTAYRCLGLDADGKIVVAINDLLAVRAYDADGKALKTLDDFRDRYGRNAMPVLDTEEKISWIAVARESSVGSSNSYSVVSVHSLFDDTVIRCETRSPRGYDVSPDHMMLALQTDQKIFVQMGIHCAPMYGGGTVMQHYGSKVRLYTFDLAKNAVVYDSSSRFSFGSLGEQGARSDAVYAAGYNIGLDQAEVLDDAKVKTVEWGRTGQEILRRYLNGYQREEGTEVRAVVLLDQGGRYTGSTGFFQNREYGTLISVRDLSSVHLPDQIANGVLQQKAATTKVLQVRKQAGAQETALHRTFQLDPHKTYYYEYEVRGAGQQKEAVGRTTFAGLRFETTQQVPATGAAGKRLFVSDAYEEDFNGTDRISRFFRFPMKKVSAGWFCGADLNRGSAFTNGVRSDEGEIEFTVPAGKEAVLSFDYDCIGDAFASAIYVDDEFWGHTFPEGAGSGHYTHPELLAPGRHSIRMTIASYGKLPQRKWARLDNLRVELVSPRAPAAVPARPVSYEKGDGWIQVSGQFQTPLATVAYDARPAEWIRSDLVAPGWITRQEEKTGFTLDLRLPRGKTAIAAGFRTENRLSARGGVNYRFTGPENRSWRLQGNTMDSNVKYRIANDIRLALPVFSGNAQLKVDWKNQYARGEIPWVELCLADARYGPITENRFFVRKAAGQVFLDNERFDGNVMLTVTGGEAEEWMLRNFRLYTMEDGMRVSVAERTLQDPVQAALWQPTGGSATLIDFRTEEEPERPALIYRKGELVRHQVAYSDYENDPSLRSFWRYTHTPFNDGPHPEAHTVLTLKGALQQMTGKVLQRPIERFQIDGRYVAEHWQMDNTDRTGGKDRKTPYERYNRNSNVAAMTFYIEGGGEAPWISGIRSDPQQVQEGDSWRVCIDVDDREKDELLLVTEVFLEGKQIYRHEKSGIRADGKGHYPSIVTDEVGFALPGVYTIVCTVSDQSGTGLGSHRFTVVTAGKIVGDVTHTDQWEQNRKRYNRKHCGEEGNQPVSLSEYLAMKEPRLRRSNVFWSGERFMLRADAAGRPEKVFCEIAGYPVYRVEMQPSGKTNAQKESEYTGSLWNRSMINRWGRKAPEELTFVFTAVYAGNVSKTHEAKVIIDTATDYWQLHRYY